MSVNFRGCLVPFFSVNAVTWLVMSPMAKQISKRTMTVKDPKRINGHGVLTSMNDDIVEDRRLNL
jgi:hypothetical protein